LLLRARTSWLPLIVILFSGQSANAPTTVEVVTLEVEPTYHHQKRPFINSRRHDVIWVDAICKMPLAAIRDPQSFYVQDS
jgi:hypothetical protein